MHAFAPAWVFGILGVQQGSMRHNPPRSTVGSRDYVPIRQPPCFIYVPSNGFMRARKASSRIFKSFFSYILFFYNPIRKANPVLEPFKQI